MSFTFVSRPGARPRSDAAAQRRSPPFSCPNHCQILAFVALLFAGRLTRMIRKFLLTAPFPRVSQLTRALRTRLSYASFKAMNNLTHTTLPDLESQPSYQYTSPRTANARTPPNHYANPVTQGGPPPPTTSSKQVSRKVPMGPPAASASATQSLFTSILAPPPTKRVRTIHNPEDPPVPAPVKGKPSLPLKKVPKSPRGAERAQGASKPKKEPKLKGKDKGKAREVDRRAHTGANAADGDIDMKAAATLTSLLLARPSLSGGASSPRSSVSAGSDTGSTQSFSHFAQSSARTVAAAESVAPPATEPSFRARTPPPRDHMHVDDAQSSLSQGVSARVGSLTPKLQQRSVQRTSTTGTPHPPSDTEAADSLLWLATSPSPVRATTAKDRETTDLPSLRSSLVGGGGLRGRVLFPSTHESNTGDGYPSSKARPLKREGSGNGSFASSATLVNDSDPSGRPRNGFKSLSRDSTTSPPEKWYSEGRVDEHPGYKSSPARHLQIPADPTVTPPTPVEERPPRLLPAPPSPSHYGGSPAYSRSQNRPTPGISSDPRSSFLSTSSAEGNSQSDRRSLHPSTPGVPFNFSDFIHVSPSPAVTGSSARPVAPALHANVGRMLFEDHHRLNRPSSASANREDGRRSGLGAGIDLVKS